MEDDVLHLRPTHGTRTLFAEDPTDRVGDIRFSAAVGADDGGHALLEHEFEMIGKGFKSMYFELRQTH